jgi:hypothetical protein
MYSKDSYCFHLSIPMILFMSLGGSTLGWIEKDIIKYVFNYSSFPFMCVNDEMWLISTRTLGTKTQGKKIMEFLLKSNSQGIFIGITKLLT